MRIFDSVTDLIGRTPLLRLSAFGKGLPATILGKIESFNPGGSVKDRIALSMVLDAEAKGLLQPGATIIEPTSGSTGIGLAMVAVSRGYKAVIIMPDTMSIERRNLLKAYGAQVVLTPGALGMKGAIDKAEEMAKELPGSWIAGQFTNPANPAVHIATTGPEIWEDTDGQVDVLVAGVGTGGTLSGTGTYLKQMKPDVRIIAVEPAESPLLSAGQAGAHGIQGIGANFVPDTLDRQVIDEIITVPSQAACETAKAFAHSEGVLAGISSGAALWAAQQLAQRPEYAGKMIVAVLPDTGERYLSTGIFDS